MAAPFYSSEGLYADDSPNDVQYFVSPLRVDQIEPGFSDSPEHKFEDFKLKTYELSDVIKKSKLSQRPEFNNEVKLGMTERNSYNPTQIRKPQFSIANPNLRNKISKSEYDPHTHRGTAKSDSSWIPTFSKFEYEEDDHGKLLDNVMLSTSRLSFLKTKEPTSAKDQIRQFFDVDQQTISDAFENQRLQLENLNDRCYDLKQIYKEKQDFERE
jgi:hypothetical protein